MFSLLYISRAERALSERELLGLLAQARRNNQRAEITGLLLYKDGNFMQQLEGEEAAVRALLAVIAEDSRHCNLIVLVEGNVPKREFSDWSMGFRELQPNTAREIPGYNSFLETPLTAGEFSGDPSRARELLMLFQKIG